MKAHDLLPQPEPLDARYTVEEEQLTNADLDKLAEIMAEEKGQENER